MSLSLILDALRRNATVAASAGFVILNVVGLSYNFGLFAAMGVSYADFAQIEDFLVGAFKSPLVLLYTAAAIGLSLLTLATVSQRGGMAGTAVAVVLVLMLAFLLPTLGGYAVGRSGGGSALFVGTSMPSEIDCQVFDDGRRVIRTFEGRILSSAGGMLLVDAGGRGLMVAEDCVVAVRLIPNG